MFLINSVSMWFYIEAAADLEVAYVNLRPKAITRV